MELTALLPPALQGDLSASLAALQALLPDFLGLHGQLARQYRVHLLAASFPVYDGSRYVNRAHLFTPDGRHAGQDKQIMTRFEREEWGIAPGGGLRVFATALGRIAVALCYDAEFPLLARAQMAAGADLLLVPSCTDGWAGYHRVRIACQARALEGQCPVVQAVTIGDAPWSPAIDVNRGRAGIFCPPDRGFPDDGVLALGQPEVGGWTFATLDLAATDQVQRHGQVLNRRDWRESEQVAVEELVL